MENGLFAKQFAAKRQLSIGHRISQVSLHQIEITRRSTGHQSEPQVDGASTELGISTWSISYPMMDYALALLQQGN